MKLERLMIIFTLFIVLMCYITGISAVSNETMDNIGSEINNDQFISSNDEHAGELIESELMSNDVDEGMDNSNFLNSQSKSFSDLNNLINDFNKSEIILEDDYIYQDEGDRNFTEGISINRSVTIDGQGHVIDAQSKSRIFNVKSDNVVIKNVILMNAHFYKYYDGDEITISADTEFFESIIMGYFNGYNGVSYGLGKFKDKDYASISYVGETYDGYAIYSSGNNLKIINSSFINNHAHFGGAIYINGNNSMLINLTFNNNSASIGGAIHNRGINTKLINLTFNNNSALAGGAISNMGKSIVDNCQFYLNDAKYRGNEIYSGQGNISIQNCAFGNECDESISFQCEEWQINNITSTYFNSLVKLDIIDFRFNLTHLHEEYYNLNITFGLQPYWYPNAEFCEDYFGYSVNKKFYLNIDGNVYNLQTDENSQAVIDLKLSNGSHCIEVYNPLTKENITKSFNVSDSTSSIQPAVDNNFNNSDVNNTDIEDVNKYTSKFFSDLNNLIIDLNKSEIILEDDYVNQKGDTDYYHYFNGSDIVFSCGIYINRSVSIDGRGHVIDASKLSGIFWINASNVTLKNIKFNNSHDAGQGAITCNASDITIINCTFINCYSYVTSASVINALASNLDIINCVFINNTCSFTVSGCMCGGSVIRMNTGRIINSTFIDNYFVDCLNDDESFAAIYYNDWTCNVVNETIQYAINTGKVSEIVYMGKGIIINSTFINYPTHTITHDWNIIPFPAHDDCPTAYNNTTNPSNNNNSNSFHDLQMLINSCTDGEINLEKDYVYNNSTDFYLTIHEVLDYNEENDIYLVIDESNQGIHINKSIVINGNGHIIDAQNMTRIFNINASNVIIKNITFINAHCIKRLSNYMGCYVTGYNPFNAIVYDSDDFYDATLNGAGVIPFHYGGAIYCIGNNLKILNCSFISNMADFGGAISIRGDNSYLSNLLFMDNIANEGGAIYVSGKNTTILQSKFDFNQGIFAGSSICNHGDINIQNCNFSNGNCKSVVFYNGNWQLDNMNSTYFNSFVKFPSIMDFKYVLTHINDDYYNLNILFGIRPYVIPDCPFCEDSYGYSTNKKFCLNIDGNVYNLQTDGKSQADINLKLSNGVHSIEVYNPLTKENIIKSFNVSDSISNVQPTADNNSNNGDVNNTDIADVEINSSKSFIDLKKEIYDLNKSEIILEDDYLNQKGYDDYRDYYPNGDILEVITTGILINRSVSIDGQGHVIDANNLSEIFYLNADNITLKNIVLKNANGFNFGAVCCNASNISIINCTFINNYGIIGAVYCNNQNISIINSTFINNSGSIMGAAAIWSKSPICSIINSTFFDNYINCGWINGKYTGIYYYDRIFNVVDETIVYAKNTDKVRDIVSGNCIIINSTFKNTITHEIHYDNHIMELDYYNETNAINPSNNSSDVNNTNKTYENPSVVPDDDVDKNMSQITPTLNINAENKYIIDKGDVINIAFKTNIMNKNFWVEIPGLLSKSNLTSDNNFSATITLINIVKSGNYTVLCGFFDYNAPVVVGSDDILGVACKKIIEIICLDDVNKSDSIVNATDTNKTEGIVNTTDTNKTDSIVNTTGNKTDVIKPIASVDNSKKSSSIVVAKNKVFNKKLKTKLCPVVLKSKNGKVLKNTWITLKIKGKLFKAKTNSKGRATFKITKFYKKGNFKAVIKFKGSKKYNPISKKINIKIK